MNTSRRALVTLLAVFALFTFVLVPGFVLRATASETPESEETDVDLDEYEEIPPAQTAMFAVRGANIPKAIYEEDWQNYLLFLDDLFENDRNHFGLAVMSLYALRFADGTLVTHYLAERESALDLDDTTDFRALLLDFLHHCSVGDNGYLFYHSDDGEEKMLLAWYGSTFSIYDTFDFMEGNLDILPGF